MTFSATEAAFEGFRVVRRKPVLVLLWGAVYLAMFLVMFGVGSGSFARIMTLAQAAEQSAEPSLEDVRQLAMAYVGLSWLAPVGLVVAAVLSAAVARAVLRPAEDAWGYLRLGKDELRVMAVSVVISVMLGLASAIGFVVIGTIAHLGGASGQAVMFLIALLLGLGLVALLIWAAVRLSLAVPMTLDRGRIVILESFKATRGHFWPLLGMSVIVFIMTMVVSLLGSIVAMPITLMTGGLERLAVLDGVPAMAMLGQAWPAILGWSVVNAVLSALQLAVLYAPFSAAWQGLRDG